MPPRGRPTLVVLPPVVSSSVAPLSSASFCSATAACRSLALAASPASRRSSALLAAYCGPSSLSIKLTSRQTKRVLELFGIAKNLNKKSLSPLARKNDSSDGDAHSYHLPTRHVVTQVHSFFDHLYLYRRRRHWGSLRYEREREVIFDHFPGFAERNASD